MQPTIGFKALVERAESEIRSLTPQQVDASMGKTGLLLVDLRDIRELKRDGKIPGSVHVPRGMLEFWIDPDCPYYKDFFAAAEEIIFYCNRGWRSALATRTAQEMGLEKVCHMQGGFDRWIQDVGKVER